jgi:hypothetical protein
LFDTATFNLAFPLQGLFYVWKKRGFALKFSLIVQKCIKNVGGNNGKS